jgi:hypothetical protein
MARGSTGKKSGGANGKAGAGKQVETLVHEGARRKNIHSSEYLGM